MSEVIWTDGRIEYVEIYSGLVHLLVDGIEVMSGTFEEIDRYAKREFVSKSPAWPDDTTPDHPTESD
ncbi:MAG: hypothetical protein AAF663_06365 [Planctomycetota bacterium]